MSTDFDIPKIEARLKATGVTIDEFCKRAQVDRATWQRWKSGKVKPLLETWMRVVSAIPPEPNSLKHQTKQGGPREAGQEKIAS